MPEPVVAKFRRFQDKASEDKCTECGLVLMHTQGLVARYRASALGRSMRRRAVVVINACGGWMGDPQHRRVIVLCNEVTT